MKKWLLVVSLCSGMVFVDVVVIVNLSNGDVLDKDIISCFFLNKVKVFFNGIKVVFFVLVEGNVIIDEFNGKVLNKIVVQFIVFWLKLVFIGKG